MLMNISKKIELAANVAIIVVACLLAVVLVKNYLLVRTVPPMEQVSKPQDESQLVTAPNVSSLDIDWKQNRQTLIMAISSTCHFCAESAPFYKNLVRNKKHARVVAVVPEPVPEARSFLARIGVSVEEIKQMPLDKIGVRATPTLLLVDPSGTVKNFWVGKLSPESEADVLERLQL